MLPLAAANAAFRALFSSIASSATSSTDFFRPRPNAFFHPFFSSPNGLGAGSKACGFRLRRGGPGSSSDSSAWDDSVSSPLPNQPPDLVFRFPALPFRAWVEDEYCESGELSSLRLFNDRRFGIASNGGRKPWLFARGPSWPGG
jgi:hypothetical protein